MSVGNCREFDHSSKMALEYPDFFSDLGYGFLILNHMKVEEMVWHLRRYADDRMLIDHIPFNDLAEKFQIPLDLVVLMVEEMFERAYNGPHLISGERPGSIRLRLSWDFGCEDQEDHWSYGHTTQWVDVSEPKAWDGRPLMPGDFTVDNPRPSFTATVKAHQAAIGNYPLTGSQKKVLASMWTQKRIHDTFDGTVYMDYQDIADDTGLSKVTIGKVIRGLVAEGWLRQERRDSSNNYVRRLSVPEIAALVPA